VDPGSHREGLHGVADRGDIAVPSAPYIVQAKHVRQLRLGQWWPQVEMQAANAGKPYALIVHKRWGTTDPLDQWVTTTLRHQIGINNWYKGLI